MNFDPKDVAAQCRAFGPQVGPLPSGLDGATLLWALSGNESSYGVNCGPRHEPAFDVGGAYDNAVMAPLLAEFGSAAACSYGPLQIMFCNAPQGAKPSDFDDLPTAMQYSVAYLNRRLRTWKPGTLTTIGQIWNAGSPMQHPSPGVVAYCFKLGQNYDAGLPQT